MRFTERMGMIAGMCGPHRLIALTGWRQQSCPDPSRKERAYGKAADKILDEAMRTDVYEWIAVLSDCGQATVIEYVRRLDPERVPAAVLEPEKPTDKKKKTIKIEVEGR